MNDPNPKGLKLSVEVSALSGLLQRKTTLTDLKPGELHSVRVKGVDIKILLEGDSPDNAL